MVSEWVKEQLNALTNRHDENENTITRLKDENLEIEGVIKELTTLK